MASEIYEYRTTLRGRASRGRLRTMYLNNELQAAETLGVAHTPYGTVEVAAVIWRDGVQTIMLHTVREGVLHCRWERRRRPLSERGLTTLARRWAESPDAEEQEVSDGEPGHAGSWPNGDGSRASGNRPPGRRPASRPNARGGD